MSIDSKKITNLYNEPQSIQVVKNKWKSDSYEDRKTYTDVLASGLVMTGLCLYEGNESWKKTINQTIYVIGWFGYVSNRYNRINCKLVC